MKNDPFLVCCHARFAGECANERDNKHIEHDNNNDNDNVITTNNYNTNNDFNNATSQRDNGDKLVVNGELPMSAIGCRNGHSAVVSVL